MKSEQRFTKKPITISAWQWNESLTMLHELKDSGMFSLSHSGHVDHPDLCRNLRIQTLEGALSVSVGDWIIKGVKGEFYPCKPDIFEATYSEDAPSRPVAPAQPSCHACGADMVKTYYCGSCGAVSTCSAPARPVAPECTAIRPNSSLQCLRIQGHATPHGDSLGDWSEITAPKPESILYEYSCYNGLGTVGPVSREHVLKLMVLAAEAAVSETCENCGEREATRETDDMVNLCDPCYSDAKITDPAEARPAAGEPGEREAFEKWFNEKYFTSDPIAKRTITAAFDFGVSVGAARAAVPAPITAKDTWRDLPSGEWFFMESPDCVHRFSVMERTSSGCVSICSTGWSHEHARRDMHSIVELHNCAAAVPAPPTPPWAPLPNTNIAWAQGKYREIAKELDRVADGGDSGATTPPEEARNV